MLGWWDILINSTVLSLFSKRLSSSANSFIKSFFIATCWSNSKVLTTFSVLGKSCGIAPRQTQLITCKRWTHLFASRAQALVGVGVFRMVPAWLQDVFMKRSCFEKHDFFSSECVHVGPELAELMESIASSFFSGSCMFPSPQHSCYFPSLPYVLPFHQVPGFQKLKRHACNCNKSILKGPTESEELEELSTPPDSSSLEHSASSCDPACRYLFLLTCMHVNMCELLGGSCQPTGKHPASLRLVAHAVSLAMLGLH